MTKSKIPTISNPAYIVNLRFERALRRFVGWAEASAKTSYQMGPSKIDRMQACSPFLQLGSLVRYYQMKKCNIFRAFRELSAPNQI